MSTCRGNIQNLPPRPERPVMETLRLKTVSGSLCEILRIYLDTSIPTYRFTRNPVLYVIANSHLCEAIPVTIISDIVLTQRTRRTQREPVGWGKAGYYKRRRFFTTELLRTRRKSWRFKIATPCLPVPVSPRLVASYIRSSP